VGTEAPGHGIQSYLQATGVIACYRAPQRLKTAKSLSFLPPHLQEVIKLPALRRQWL
jgi:hypothetical protein